MHLVTICEDDSLPPPLLLWSIFSVVTCILAEPGAGVGRGVAAGGLASWLLFPRWPGSRFWGKTKGTLLLGPSAHFGHKVLQLVPS